jgi:4-diphosphocytidyl-2-C-methyl-D-erythritol kinase
VITIESPAKLTLTLAVAGVRDDGYHLIDAQMVSLELCDLITIEAAGTTSITVDGPYASGVPTDESNLVFKALTLAQRTARVHVTKNIPHGGGLGGGSTNAATILRWADFTDLTAASRIGADIPFCMVGGRAQVGGIGEIVHSLEFTPRDITLFIPPVHVPTPAVYRMWDSMGGPESDFDNDLEPAALQAVPELAVWRDRIEEVIGQRPRLAGSGATWFAPGHVEIPANSLGECAFLHTKTRPDAGRVV